jgi:hypothetical protein
MKTALMLIAFVVAGGGLVYAAVTGRIVNRRWALFDRRDDALMFWICWLFAALIFGWFIYANV